MAGGILPRRKAKSRLMDCLIVCCQNGWIGMSLVYDRRHGRSKHLSSSLLLCILSPSERWDFLAFAQITIFLLAFMSFGKQLLGLFRRPVFAERGELSGGSCGGFLNLGKHLGFAGLRFDERRDQVGNCRTECVKLLLRVS